MHKQGVWKFRSVKQNRKEKNNQKKSEKDGTVKKKDRNDTKGTMQKHKTKTQIK